jgi:hypothetical protein
MRTTLTLDPDLAHQIQERVAKSRKSFKSVVNELLKKGLATDAQLGAPQAFVQSTLKLGWNDALDPIGFNRLADALALEADLEVLRRDATNR